MRSSSINTQPLLENTEKRALIIDYFISEPEKSNSVDLYRSRTLVGMSLSIGLVLLLGALYIWFGSEMERQYQLIALYIMVPMALIFILAVFVYKRTRSYAICANTTIFAGFFGVSVAVYIVGGPIYSPAQFIITFPVILSFCLLGKYWGIFWTLVTFMTQAMMGMMVLVDFDFPSLIDQGKVNEVQILIFILTLLATSGVLVIYESMQSRLQIERDMQEQRFLFLATHDVLTELPNRILFYDRAGLAVSRSNREGTYFAILYMDVNGFKPVNDNYGHEAGDYVLKVVSSRLQALIRETDLVARIGGDEFAIIIEGLQSEDNVDPIAHKIIKEIEKPIEYDGNNISIGSSIGVSFYPNDSKDIEVLVSHADAAMYVAKGLEGHYVRFDSIKN